MEDKSLGIIWHTTVHMHCVCVNALDGVRVFSTQLLIDYSVWSPVRQIYLALQEETAEINKGRKSTGVLL